MALTEGTWVRLCGDSFDLAQIGEYFDATPSIVFAQNDEEEWWMKADAFDGVANAAEVRCIATDLIRTINGCAQVLWGNHRPATADGAVAFVDREGVVKSRVILAGSISSRSRVGIATVGAGGQSPPSPPRHLEWVRLAVTDANVASALRILGEPEPTWAELYHLFELVESHIGGSVATAGWVSRNELQRFRQTANSRRAVGERARHGADYAPPTRPMTLAEAQAMARTVTESFLNSLL